MIPLPASYEARARQNTHPGLALDKFVDYQRVTVVDQFAEVKFSEAVQRPAIDAVASMPAPFSASEFEALRQRRKDMLDALGALVSHATTAGPFTLHLSRASALENAGLRLHPIYGFAFLPGTGIKGLAKAYALTIGGLKETDAQVLKVFGSSAADKHAQAGDIVFHDAWPTTYPKLVEDILNTHHKDYYSAPDQHVPPPGDWEEPSIVSFLAVAAGTTYDFPLSARRGDADSRALLKTAQQWLIGGLTVLGAGAKTAAGYGHFVTEADCAEVLSEAKRETYELKLITPAFLAGPKQSSADCELRPATLRGLLRSWWRTLHAGFVGDAALRRLESAVWGSTSIGGAARFTLETVSGPQPLPFDRSAIVAGNRLPAPNRPRTTQGLTYHSYGMDEVKSGVSVRRSFIPPGAKWNIHLQARGSRYADTEISADSVRLQAKSALWLLCRYGGVGAKNRKGFGSFQLPKGFEDFSIEKCKQLAAEFRAACGLHNTAFNASRAGSPSWEQALPFKEISSGLKNPWLILDTVAASAQVFAQSYKHRREKKALGLPRRIGNPASGNFSPGAPVGERHSSPVTYHLSLVNDSYTVGVTAFPASRLPNMAQSRKLLDELLTHLQSDLPARFAAVKGADGPVQNPLRAGEKPAPQQKGPELKAHAVVQAVIVADPKHRGRVFARVEGTDLEGNVMNSGDMPAELRTIGTKVQLKIANVNLTNKSIGFNYPKT